MYFSCWTGVEPFSSASAAAGWCGGFGSGSCQALSFPLLPTPCPASCHCMLPTASCSSTAISIPILIRKWRMAEEINAPKKKISGGKQDPALAQLSAGFHKAARCHPRISQLPQPAKGSKAFNPHQCGTAQPSQKPYTGMARHVWEWETQNRSHRCLRAAPACGTCPRSRWPHSTAGSWARAWISGVLTSTDLFFLSRNLLFFMCSQILHLNCTLLTFSLLYFSVTISKSVCWFRILLLLCCWEGFEIKLLGKCLRFQCSLSKPTSSCW